MNGPRLPAGCQEGGSSLWLPKKPLGNFVPVATGELDSGTPVLPADQAHTTAAPALVPSEDRFTPVSHFRIFLEIGSSFSKVISRLSLKKK